jgi:hypothetical protein
MVHQKSAEIIILPVRLTPDAEAILEWLQATNRAFAALAAAIDEIDSPLPQRN